MLALDNTEMAVAESSLSNENALTIYMRVMNTGSSYITSQYFSDNVILDWFGRTLAGKENVLNFLLEEIHLDNHDIIKVKSSVKEMNKLALERALSRFRQPSLSDKEDWMDDDSGFGSVIYESSDSSFSSEGSLTPRTNLSYDLSRLNVAKNQTTIPNWKTPMNSRLPSAPSMFKKPCMLLKRLKEVDVPRGLLFLDAAGVVSGTIPNEIYDAGPVRRWSKHCHLQLGYLPPTTGETLRFAFLLYNDEMPCRRNLSKIFDQCE